MRSSFRGLLFASYSHGARIALIAVLTGGPAACSSGSQPQDNGGVPGTGSSSSGSGSSNSSGNGSSSGSGSSSGADDGGGSNSSSSSSSSGGSSSGSSSGTAGDDGGPAEGGAESGGSQTRRHGGATACFLSEPHSQWNDGLGEIPGRQQAVSDRQQLSIRAELVWYLEDGETPQGGQ